jgi:hypothetical protein
MSEEKTKNDLMIVDGWLRIIDGSITLVGGNLNLLGGSRILGACVEIASDPPGCADAGQIFFNSTDRRFYGFNGKNWTALSN